MEAKRKPGRPLKLTPEIIESIANAVANGLPYKSAAAAAGVSESAFHAWMARAKEGKRPFVELLERLRDAEEKAKAFYLLKIRSLANGGRIVKRTSTKKDAAGNIVAITETTEELPPSLAASIFWLERRFPAEFGPRQQVALANGENPFEVSLFGQLLIGSGTGDEIEPQEDE